MPDASPPPTLAEQIYTQFLADLAAEGTDGALTAAAMRACLSHGVIGDRSAIVLAARASLTEAATGEN